MKFINEEHEIFYREMLKILYSYGKTDLYYRSLVYTLGISETTREHFRSIFNIKDGEINIDSLQAPWQTDTSEKVTRMAFSLWNRCAYDSTEDARNNKASSRYNPSEIFSCTYAPYFYEGVKIRYPEYTRETQQIEQKNQIRTKNLEKER